MTTYKESIFFQYSDIFFSYFFDNDTHCTSRMPNHSLTYIYDGEMVIEERGNITTIGKGECAFIKRDNRITLTKRAKNGACYKGIFMSFKRKVLRDFYAKLPQSDTPKASIRLEQSVVKLPKNVEIESLFNSMTPFFNQDVEPQEAFMQLKVQEGIYALLNIDKNFYPTLFDFNEPWKLDILQFMNENFMCELSLEDMANYTGRSLATFKRDFKRISDLTPRKWLLNKRLEVAHEMIKHEHKKVSQVYLDVGFKNLSHFSKLYKETYGVAPTK